MSDEGVDDTGVALATLDTFVQEAVTKAKDAGVSDEDIASALHAIADRLEDGAD